MSEYIRPVLRTWRPNIKDTGELCTLRDLDGYWEEELVVPVLRSVWLDTPG